jgi:hypothetical protein
MSPICVARSTTCTVSWTRCTNLGAAFAISSDKIQAYLFVRPSQHPTSGTMEFPPLHETVSNVANNGGGQVHGMGLSVTLAPR